MIKRVLLFFKYIAIKIRKSLESSIKDCLKMLILGLKLGKSFVWGREKFWGLRTFNYPHRVTLTQIHSGYSGLLGCTG